MQLNWTKRISLTQSGVDEINAVAGVYLLIYHNSSKDKCYVYYVGQTKDLNDRLTKHLLGNEIDKCCQEYLDNYTCYFRAAAVSQQADRDGVEVALYNHYKPSCVDRIPDANPIDINFY